MSRSCAAGAGTLLLFAMVIAGGRQSAQAYPTDAFERTGIRRLVWQRAIDAGTRPGRKLPPGAQQSSGEITLKMLDAAGYRLTKETPKDPTLQAGLEAILRRHAFRAYNVALLDITDPARPRFAAVRENEAQTPGSVAKVLIAAALFQALKDRFGDNLAAREAFLRDVRVRADDWAMPNHHEVPVVDGERVAVRAVRRGDVFSLWEWADHALSASSNAAASMLWREVTLLHLLADAYPPAAYDAVLFGRWERPVLRDTAFRLLEAPLVAAGIDPESFALRMFFTKGAGKYIEGDRSLVTPLALVQWLLAVEQGRMVDVFSSLELKRLLYLTRRRVRYAKAPALAEAAVFFKSGSLYRCAPEPGFTCVQYQGNVVNVLNALVEVEAPRAKAMAATALSAAETAGAPPVTEEAEEAITQPVTYIIAVMSNELRRNAAEDHAILAGGVHELVQHR